MKVLHYIALVLLIIGGLNWGLTAFHYNVVEKVFGINSTPTMIIYVLVGLAALLEIFTHKSNCKACATKTATPAM